MILADPPGSSALVAAVQWLEATLLGTIATTIAVTCVAWVGVMMLSGRVNIRHGVTTILGCFLLFGAASIAAGIRCAAEGGACGVGETSLAQVSAASSSLPESPALSLPSPPPSDKNRYAGASSLR